jgi:oxygen-independent coproporphyrinogen-3 oxidase
LNDTVTLDFQSRPAPETLEPGFGLYIHIPFCVSKCSYCAFSSVAGRARLMESYVRALHREIEKVSLLGTGRTAQSVYFGGGTPSLLAPVQLNALLLHLRQSFDVAGDAEITIEANPETVTDARIHEYLEAGANRISMGVQSLDSQELVELGRPHTAERAIVAFHTIRRAGCRNINLDLLYGLPGQTVAGWRDTLTRTLELDPDHLSAYALTPEPGTDIGTAVAAGALTLATDDVVYGQESLLFQAVARIGLSRYEISNYAKPGFSCRHNLLYWRCDDWIGMGASAHTHLSGRRWWNQFDPENYIHSVNHDASIAGQETLTLNERMSEALAFGLRTAEGVSRARFSARFGADPWSVKAPEFTQLVDQGLIIQDDRTIRLTASGLALADSVALILF